LTKDTRDLRDPRKFPDLSAEYRNSQRAYEQKWTFHRFVDEYMKKVNVPDYPGDESTVTQTVREYRAELQARADSGDRYALSRLAGLPYDEPGDST